jgi:hypothetical protein
MAMPIVMPRHPHGPLRAWRALVPLVAAACAAPRSAPPAAPVAPAAGALPSPATRAERTRYLETSSHAEVLAFIDTLVARGAPIASATLATSTEGRRVPLLVASRPLVRTPAEARALGRPVVYVQANIHAGEVEGKEAILALLRDWSASPAPTVLDSLVLVVVPNYNPDGNDRLGAQERNRGAQQGPERIGERPNGMGLDLNRDYIKAEAPETRGALAALSAWDPDVFMDLHTTNGSYHGYALTYAPSLHPAAPLGAYTADTLLPEVRRRVRARHGFETFPYGNFTSADGRETATAAVKAGWRTYEHVPRFGTNYVGLRGRVSILSEAYSHDPFARRVAATRAFVQEVLSLVAERRAEVGARVAAGSAAATFGAGRTPPVAFRSRFATRADTQEVLVEVLERVADSTQRTEAGVPRGLRRTGRVERQRMPVVDRFEAALAHPASPHGYAILPEGAAAVALLRAHGVPVTVLERPLAVAVERFVVDSVQRSARPFQGHREVTVRGRWERGGTRTLPAGSAVVPTGTPRDLLAAILLDPLSDDGVHSWNLFDALLARGAEAPVLRLLAPTR